jgi:mRNA interferase RelE/StbE
MYKISFTKQAYKAFRRMPKNASRLIREKLEHVAADPYAQHNNVTRLQNRPGYRLRVGNWRVIYELQDDRLVVLILKIGSRGEIYR